MDKTNTERITLDDVSVPYTILPDGVDVEDDTPLGKGSNNKAIAVSWSGKGGYVLRIPRRRSDTQQKGSALWELRQTLKASQLGVTPLLHKAWFARHAKGMWTSGLYMIMDRFDCTLDDAICDHPDRLRANDCALAKAVAAQVVSGLEKLANVRMFVFDLKPSNIVLRFTGREGVEARIVDFGKDFCEWMTSEQGTDADVHAPILGGLRVLTQTADDPDGLLKHIVFATMLVQLASTATYNIYEDRSRHRLGRDDRRAINGLASHATELLDSMQGRHIAMVRWVLRTDDVRGVLRHYHGRRNAGTGRTLALARGDEL